MNYPIVSLTGSLLRRFLKLQEPMPIGPFLNELLPTGCGLVCAPATLIYSSVLNTEAIFKI